MQDLDQLSKTYNKMRFILIQIISGLALLASVFYWVLTIHHSTGVDVGFLRMAAIIEGVIAVAASFPVKNAFLNAPGPRSVKQLFTATLVAIAICEGSILFGFVVAFMGRNPNDLIFPVFLGIVAFGLHFPRYQQWVDWIQGV